MAAATKLLQLRPNPTTTTTTTTISTYFLSFSTTTTTTPTPDTDPNNNSSSSSEPNPPPPRTTPPPESQSQPQSPFASYFSDVRASLKQQQQRNLQSPTPRKTFSFNPNQPNPPSKIESLEEIRRNLSEFRRRSAAPPPPLPPSSASSSSTTPPPHHSPHKPISFQELYQQNAAAKGEGFSPDASKVASKISFEAIRNSIRQLASSSPVKNKNEGSGRMSNSSLFSFKDSLTPGQAEARRVIGSDPLPSLIFRPELEQKEKGNATDSKSRMQFLRTYDLTELGEKLRALRPEKRDKKDWFSLEELSERLVKLREMEEKENDSRLPGVTFRDLRQSLTKLKDDEEEKARKSTLNRFDILRNIGETPGYMLSPPKDELVEKYFHPDNMSASEKMKLELKKVRDDFKMSETDCGSAQVQVAQLTTKIKHLSDVLHKKDKHSRKGLEAMVQRRKKLLKYLRRTDWDSYCFVLSKLGLRDNPDYKEKKKKEKKRT